MIKLNIAEKYVTIQKSVIKEKLGFGLRAMEKSPLTDAFDASKLLEATNPITSPISKRPAKTIADLKTILEQPEMKERAIELNPYIEENLKNRALIPAFEKLLTAENSTLTGPNITMIGECITLENAKYLDFLLGADSAGKTIDWEGVGCSGFCDVLVNLSKIKEPKLIEILSDTKTNFSKKLKLIEKEEKILGLNELKNPKIRKIAEKITDRVNPFPDFYTSFSSVEEKMKNVKDSKIKSHVNQELLALDKIKNEQKIAFKLCTIESLLDAYHVAKKHYNSTTGEVSSFYSSISRLYPEAKSNLKNFLLARNPVEAKAARQNADGFLVANFKKESRLEALKQYIVENQEPEMADYMYKKYYVNSLHPKAKAEHLKILNEFGTKLFYVNNPKAPSMVYDELARWKKVGGSKFVPPSTIDLSQVKSVFIENEFSGFFCKQLNSISVISDGALDIRETLRHEIRHGNDKRPNAEAFGVTNGVDVAEIVGRRKYSEEFANAGIEAVEGVGCDYAYTDKSEFVAVAAEGDCSRYSEEFKKVLVKLGMPKWFFNIELAHPAIKRAAEKIAELKAAGK